MSYFRNYFAVNNLVIYFLIVTTPQWLRALTLKLQSVNDIYGLDNIFVPYAHYVLYVTLSIQDRKNIS